jgi:hypothetical protein
MVRDELRQLRTWEDRHRKLAARLLIATVLTILVGSVGSILVWMFERHASGTQIHTYGDAVFFTTVQLLTVSSQIRNPLTTAGRIVDVALEVWAIFVITALAGSFAGFFGAGDSS